MALVEAGRKVLAATARLFAHIQMGSQRAQRSRLWLTLPVSCTVDAERHGRGKRLASVPGVANVRGGRDHLRRAACPRSPCAACATFKLKQERGVELSEDQPDIDPFFLATAPDIGARLLRAHASAHGQRRIDGRRSARSVKTTGQLHGVG
eukprot:scaffold97736_cov64-Phaeocystis_antarctica.AAC.4